MTERRATANIFFRSARAKSSPRCAQRIRPACARPTTRSASAGRSNIRSPASRWRCRREGDTLADLRVAFTGTNPRPVLLDGTAELIGRRLDERVIKGLDAAGARPDHADEDDVHARPLPPARRRRAGAPAADATVRRLTGQTGMGLSDKFTERRPYNAVFDFVDANVARGLAKKTAFIDPDRSLSYGELQARTIRFANALRALGIRKRSASRCCCTTRSISGGVLGHGARRPRRDPAQYVPHRAAIRLYPRRFPRHRAGRLPRRWRRRSGR